MNIREKCILAPFVESKVNLIFLIFVALLMNDSISSEIQHPYFASPERVKTIQEGYKKIKTGMDINQVKEILGEPDEIKDLYEPKIKTSKIVGFTYWYLIQRIKSTGGQNERNEKLVRISFELNGAVIRVDRW
ncbi:MAG: DUF3862 domain-containing protein [Gammaproteobacteria bacterium]|nr:DUF3862 domain-containing protein [Gammaproteobacteria bacterium]